jgi:hypothetical protein
VTTAHLFLAYAAAAVALLTLVGAIAALVLGVRLRLLLDRLILVAVVVLLLAAVSGLPMILFGGPPADVLHLVYGAVAPVILLGGRYLGRGGSMGRRAAIVAIAALALLGVVYRLFTTGSGPAS